MWHRWTSMSSPVSWTTARRERPMWHRLTSMSSRERLIGPNVPRGIAGPGPAIRRGRRGPAYGRIGGPSGRAGARTRKAEGASARESRQRECGFGQPVGPGDQRSPGSPCGAAGFTSATAPSPSDGFPAAASARPWWSGPFRRESVPARGRRCPGAPFPGRGTAG